MVRHGPVTRCCEVATPWPEPCVRAGQKHSGTSTMSTPVARDRAAPSEDSSETQGLAALLPIGPDLKARIRVLIVDDEHTLRESCATVLRQDGYDVTVCGRAQEALGLPKRRGFDIGLVQLYRPQLDERTLLWTARTT